MYIYFLNIMKHTYMNFKRKLKNKDYQIYPPHTLTDSLSPPTMGDAYPILETPPQPPELYLQPLWSPAQLKSPAVLKYEQK